jgi:uncharacterized protein YgiB involved in biofilm formation
MRRLITCLAIATLAALALYIYQPATASPVSKPVTLVTVAPSATPTLADCEAEDGYGVALCMWDGVVSGNCAPSYVGSNKVSAECVALMKRDPEGVNECVETYNTIDTNEAKKEGWTFEECLKAFE